MKYTIKPGDVRLNNILRMSLIAGTIYFFLFTLSTITPVYAQNCSCAGSCNVGFVCDYGPCAGSSGPATWECWGGCCFRPAPPTCAGASACHTDGYHVNSRIGCAPASGCGGPT